MAMNRPVLTSRNIGIANRAAKGRGPDVQGTAADAVGQRGPGLGGEDADGRGDAQGDQGLGLVRQVLAVEVGNHVRDGHGVAGGLGDAQADALDDVAPVRLDDLHDGGLHDGAAVLDLVEDRGLGNLGADDQAHDHQHDAGQERDAPGQFAAEVDAAQEGQVGQQQANREAGLDDAGVLALGSSTVRARSSSGWRRPIRRRRPGPGRCGRRPAVREPAGPPRRRWAAGRWRRWPGPSGSGRRPGRACGLPCRRGGRR